LRSHPGNTIVATNKADDCTEQGGNESRNAKKAEYPEQQNTMVVNVSRDRYVEEESKKNKTTEATNWNCRFFGSGRDPRPKARTITPRRQEHDEEGSICASMVHAADGYVACGCVGSITKKQRSDVVHLNVDRSRYDNERSRHTEPCVNPADDQLMRQIHKRYQNKAFT
jgi:hypothetical protein